MKIGNRLSTTDLRRTFSKRDTTNWSYKLYETTESINDTGPCYHISLLGETKNCSQSEHLPERNKEALLKKTMLQIKN